MGYTHILTIHEDGIRDAKTNSGFDPENVQSVGLGVLKLCLEPTFGQGEQGSFRVTWHDIKNMGACLNWIDEVHSSEYHLFFWAENCLRRVGDLTIDQLKEAQIEISRIIDSKQAAL